MGEVVGRATCPVCGEQLQDLKVNKNNKLYCYCDNGCKWQLNSKSSRAVLAALRSGKSVNLEKVGYIRPVTGDAPAPAPVFAKRDDLEEDLGI